MRISPIIIKCFKEPLKAITTSNIVTNLFQKIFPKSHTRTVKNSNGNYKVCILKHSKESEEILKKARDEYNEKIYKEAKTTDHKI